MFSSTSRSAPRASRSDSRCWFSRCSSSKGANASAASSASSMTHWAIPGFKEEDVWRMLALAMTYVAASCHDFAASHSTDVGLKPIPSS